MKFKVAAMTTLAAVAIASAPVAAAAPNSNANGNSGSTPRNTIGQTISAIAKSGGGAAGVLGALVQFKPGNLGLANALQRVIAPKPTPTPTPAPTPTVTPTA
ncbi:MAG TPA: hypothetical protein PLH92_12140 [Mycobacterium sp.]|uniref:hypothetical protein n=1 Tax=Mycolicibacterium sp. TaxID=2320850 RepID=UPI0025D9D2ED|nr:hypothetical protein [Mycolicibacterium sp.]HPX37222.1 hypothetical protein [Mycobacterium sp.]HQC77460.1 hypothetical protein [Mycobacterium sp.]